MTDRRARDPYAAAPRQAYRAGYEDVGYEDRYDPPKRGRRISPGVIFLAIAIIGSSVVLKIAANLRWDQAVWLIFFSYLYYLLGVLVPRRYLANLDKVRYVITMALVLMTLGVLMKMGVRLGFDIKYVLEIPQFNLNI